MRRCRGARGGDGSDRKVCMEKKKKKKMRVCVCVGVDDGRTRGAAERVFPRGREVRGARTARSTSSWSSPWSLIMPAKKSTSPTPMAASTMEALPSEDLAQRTGSSQFVTASGHSRLGSQHESVSHGQPNEHVSR